MFRKTRLILQVVLLVGISAAAVMLFTGCDSGSGSVTVNSGGIVKDVSTDTEAFTVYVKTYDFNRDYLSQNQSMFRDGGFWIDWTETDIANKPESILYYNVVHSCAYNGIRDHLIGWAMLKYSSQYPNGLCFTGIGYDPSTDIRITLYYVK